MTERNFSGHQTMYDLRGTKVDLACGLRGITMGHRSRSRRKKDKISVLGLVDDWASSVCIEDTSRTAASKPGVFPI